MAALGDALQARLEEARLRPDTRDTWDADRAFGEVRALAHGELSGGELWEEWAPVFEAFPNERLPEVGAYLAQELSTNIPLKTLEDVRLAVTYASFRAWVRAFEGQGVHFFEPPLSPERFDAWVHKYSLTPPPYLADFLRTIGGGVLLDEHTHRTHGWIAFVDDGEGYGADWRYMPLGVLVENSEEWELIAIAIALTCFLKDPAREAVAGEDLETEPSEEARDLADGMFVLEWTFHEDERDHERYLVMRGPWAGRVLRAAGEHIYDGGELNIRTYSWEHHFVDWLREATPRLLSHMR